MKARTLALAAFAGFAASRAGAHEDARSVTVARLAQAASEVRAFRDAVGELPASRDGLEAVTSTPASIVDGWGRPLVYVRVVSGFWLISWGADGVPGGTGDAADLVEMSR